MLKLPMVVEKGCEIPFYAHEGDAGLDLSVKEDVIIRPHAMCKVGSGIRAAIPKGYVGMLYPRSGFSTKNGIVFPNAVGVIDSTYRGEIGLPLLNINQFRTVKIPKGTRVAQLVIQKCETCRIELVESLDETERGEGGFGSTGQ